jgi:hypothetical protein
MSGNFTIGERPADLRLLRLLDLERHETIEVQCVCGYSVQYAWGMLQRKHRVRSDTLVFDLQFRFRCKQCSRWRGFRIALIDERNRGDIHKVHDRTVIVPGGEV